MSDLRARDWLWGVMLLLGLCTYLGFEWAPGLILFIIGAVGVVANAARWESS